MTIPFLQLRAAYAELKPELDEAYHRLMRSRCYILGREVDLRRNTRRTAEPVIALGSAIASMRSIL